MADIKAVGGVSAVLCHVKHCSNTPDVGKKIKGLDGHGVALFFSEAFLSCY